MFVLDMLDELMVEDYVDGCELICIVMGNCVLMVMDIIIDSWYDYYVKYVEGGFCYEVFVKVFVEIFDVCMEMFLKVYQVLGCCGIFCIDFCWDESKGFVGFILFEINI